LEQEKFALFIWMCEMKRCGKLHGMRRKCFLVAKLRSIAQSLKNVDSISTCQVLMNNAGLFNRTNWKLMLDVNLGGLSTGNLDYMESLNV
jgi:hypothetical protein